MQGVKRAESTGTPSDGHHTTWIRQQGRIAATVALGRRWDENHSERCCVWRAARHPGQGSKRHRLLRMPAVHTRRWTESARLLFEPPPFLM